MMSNSQLFFGTHEELRDSHAIRVLNNRIRRHKARRLRYSERLLQNPDDAAAKRAILYHSSIVTYLKSLRDRIRLQEESHGRLEAIELIV